MLHWLQNEADKSFAWSFLGFWVGIIFGVVGLYLAVFYQREPRLLVEILSLTPILSVREKIDKLKILYDNIDIIESKKELYVLTLRISNNGRANIVKGDYDRNAPLSLEIIDPNTTTAITLAGEQKSKITFPWMQKLESESVTTHTATSEKTIKIIQKPEVIKASEGYLSDNLKLNLYEDEKTVIVEPIILDSQQFFIVKLVALISEGLQPKIKVRGKIAGVRTIKLMDELDSYNTAYITNLILRWILLSIVAFTITLIVISILL